MSTTVCLGQNLYREALDQGNLDPFAEAATMLGGDSEPLEQANILKAIRFGLAGIALDGWQNQITQPLADPMNFGSDRLKSQFIADILPPHDQAVIDKRSPYSSRHYTKETQGEFALQTLGDFFVDTAKTYFSEGDHEVSGIRLSSVFEATKDYVLLGKEHGIDQIPDAYSNANPFYQDFFSTRENTGQMINPARSFALAARNPIRHTRDPIEKIMEHFADPYTSRPRNIPSETDMIGFDIDQQLVNATLLNVMRHASRASQRADGSSVVTDRERQAPYSISVEETGRGTEATWPSKYDKPAPYLPIDETPPQEGMAIVTTRNKCPIGYTPDAFSPMPITKIMDAILVYLQDNKLNDPRVFMSPKRIASVI